MRRHLRKKKHFRVNPRNKYYDRFYLNNYLKCKADDDAFDEQSGDFDEWEEEIREATMCLFDEKMFDTPEECSRHLKESHGLDLSSLEVYKRIRFVNYIRSLTSHFACQCGSSFNTQEALSEHFSETKHDSIIPNDNDPVWLNPNLYFSFFDNDPLLTIE